MMHIPDNRKLVDEARDIYIEDTAWIKQAQLALSLLGKTDHYVNKSVERGTTLSPAFTAWRDQLRSVVSGVADAVASDVIPSAFAPIELVASEPALEPDLFDTDLLPPRLPPLDARMSEWGEVGEAVPEDIAQLVMGGETLGAAVDRMTPGIDELLDMAQALSDGSLEKAINTIEAERANEWTERLYAERAQLRLKRGTEDENLARENLINRVANVFARVGAKR